MPIRRPIPIVVRVGDFIDVRGVEKDGHGDPGAEHERAHADAVHWVQALAAEEIDVYRGEDEREERDGEVPDW